MNPPFKVISDTHFYHDNIVKYCNRMEHTGGRHHHAYMVDKWNSVVGDTDKVLHLGDLTMVNHRTKQQFLWDIAPRLNGDKYLILGNHDSPKHLEFYTEAGFKVIAPFTMPYKGIRVSFDHYPWKPKEFNQGEVRVHGHIHNNGYPKTTDWRDGAEPTQPNQANVSVEVIDYTPQCIDRLLDNYVN